MREMRPGQTSTPIYDQSSPQPVWCALTRGGQLVAGLNAASLMKIFESFSWQAPSDDVARNRRQLSSRMIMSGFTINARRAGRTLANVTTPANTIGAASHTHKAGEPLPRVNPLIHRENAKDTSNPARVPVQASRTPSPST